MSFDFGKLLDPVGLFRKDPAPQQTTNNITNNYNFSPQQNEGFLDRMRGGGHDRPHPMAHHGRAHHRGHERHHAASRLHHAFQPYHPRHHC